jgi:hypothetical protein
LGEDEAITTYEGLTWSNFKASSTSPIAPSTPNAAVPTDTAASIELNSAVFHLASIDIAGAPGANPVTVKGFDVTGTQTVSKTVYFTTVYATYDLSEFANVAKVEFTFPISNAAGLDNWVFV